MATKVAAVADALTIAEFVSIATERQATDESQARVMLKEDLQRMEQGLIEARQLDWACANYMATRKRGGKLAGIVKGIEELREHFGIYPR